MKNDYHDKKIYANLPSAFAIGSAFRIQSALLSDYLKLRSIASVLEAACANCQEKCRQRAASASSSVLLYQTHNRMSLAFTTIRYGVLQRRFVVPSSEDTLLDMIRKEFVIDADVPLGLSYCPDPKNEESFTVLPFDVKILEK